MVKVVRNVSIVVGNSSWSIDNVKYEEQSYWQSEVVKKGQRSDQIMFAEGDIFKVSAQGRMVINLIKSVNREHFYFVFRSNFAAKLA